MNSNTIHEAGHWCVLAAYGYPPPYMASYARGGKVLIPPGTPHRVRAIAAASGQIAQQVILCDDDAEVSAADLAAIELAADMEPVVPREAFFEAVQRQACQRVAEFSAQIVAMAEELCHHPFMKVPDIRAACRRRSELRCFRQLYPDDPKPQPVMHSRGRSPIDYPFLPRHEKALLASLAKRRR